MNVRPEQVGDMRKRHFTAAAPDALAGIDHKLAVAGNGDLLASDACGRTTRLGFDNRGFLGTIASPSGRTWRIQSNENGRTTEFRTPAGLALGLAYNEQGQIAQLTRGRNQVFGFYYDGEQRLSSVMHADGTSTRIGYAANGNIASITDRLGVTESYRYNERGKLAEIEDGKGAITTYQYATGDFPVRVRYADGAYESYEYDGAGNLRRILDQQGPLATISSDADGRPVAIEWSDGETTQFSYDAKGNITRAANSQGVCLFQYDDSGRLIEENQRGYALRYEYDACGALTAMTYPSGEKVAFQYDGDLRLTGVTDWSGGRHQYSYSDDDRRIQWKLPNGLTAKLERHETGLPASVQVSSAQGQALFSTSYQYDGDDRLTRFTDSDFGEKKYTYDRESRLLAVDSERPWQRESFGYDAAGNRTAENGTTASFNARDQLQASARAKCRYDHRGNLTALAEGGVEWRFAYNSRNQLVRAHSNAGQTITFGYDAFGRRLWKRTADAETAYIWAGETLIREIETKASSRRMQDFLYLPGTHLPLATRINGSVLYYHNDHLGTPRRMSSSAGQVVWSGDFTAYGAAGPNTSPGPGRLRFPGQYHDEETGLYYNRFRYYSPTLGRYVTRDPAGYFGGLNVYAYAQNDPVNQADILGVFPWKKALAIAGAVVAGVAVTAAVIAAAPVVLPALGICAASAVAAGTLGGAIVAAAATVIGGAAAGAVGVALNEGLEKGFDQICATDVLKGAGLGALAALPFAVLPFLPAVATGVAGFAVAGGASGAIGYASDVASGHAALSFWEAAKYIGLGALTAGVFRFAAGRFSAWRSAKTGYPKATPESDASAQKVVDELNNPENQFNASQKRRMVVALDHGDGTSTVGISGNPDKTAPIIERLQPKVGDKIKLVPANPDAPLQPAPDPRSPGAVYPGGKVCAEPGAFTGAEGKPVKGMTTQWAGEAGRNPQPVSPGSQYANPCPSCDHNKGTIMNLGKPSPAAGAAAAGAQTTGRDGGGSEGQ